MFLTCEKLAGNFSHKYNIVLNWLDYPELPRLGLFSIYLCHTGIISEVNLSGCQMKHFCMAGGESMLCVPPFLVLRGLWSSLCFPSTPFLILTSSWPHDSCVLFCLPFISAWITHCSVCCHCCSFFKFPGDGGKKQQQSSLGFVEGWTFYSN